MSFVNTLSNDVWTDADITRRTEAMVHSITPREEEVILTRKVMAVSMGQWTLTETEQAELAAYQAACFESHQAGLDARADMALLQATLGYEAAPARLLIPEVEAITVEGVITNASEIEADIAQRAAAQAVIDSATPEVLALYALRNPVPEPVIEDEPQ